MKTFQDFVADAKTRITEITPADFKQWMDEGRQFTLIDTREESEYAVGKFGNAVHVARGVLELKIDGVQPQRDALIVVYCGGGNRSALVADVMQQMGYTNVYSLAGGWKNWPYDQAHKNIAPSACSL